MSFTSLEIQRVVWELLDEHPGRRPTMREVAEIRGCTPLQLRRGTERIQRSLGQIGYCATFRDTLTYSCLTYARLLINRGTKIEAAMRLAGFHQKTNFNRQCRDFLGNSPKNLRNRGAA